MSTPSASYAYDNNENMLSNHARCFKHNYTDFERLSPDKRGYRTSEVMVGEISGNPAYKELALSATCGREHPL